MGALYISSDGAWPEKETLSTALQWAHGNAQHELKLLYQTNRRSNQNPYDFRLYMDLAGFDSRRSSCQASREMKVAF